MAGNSFPTRLERLGPSADGDGNYEKYSILVSSTKIETIVTEDSVAVDNWISELRGEDDSKNCNVVGLDVRRRKMSDGEAQIVAIILCAHRRCLIFRISKADGIPESLRDFLSEEGNVFVGFKVKAKLDHLARTFSFGADAESQEVTALVAAAEGVEFPNLEEVIKEAYKKKIKKPVESLNAWNNKHLKKDNIQTAGVDAFFCCAIGEKYLHGTRAFEVGDDEQSDE